MTADDLPGRASVAQEDDKLIRDFRQLVRTQLGELSLAIFDTRLAGEETKALAARPDLGYPSAYVIKRTVQSIKTLAQQYATSLGDPAFLRSIERAMDGKRRRFLNGERQLWRGRSDSLSVAANLGSAWDVVKGP